MAKLRFSRPCGDKQAALAASDVLFSFAQQSNVSVLGSPILLRNLLFCMASGLLPSQSKEIS